jgi:hypothetical protein
MNCPLCGLSSFKFNETESSCKHEVSLVADVTIDEVKEAIHEVLDVKFSEQAFFVSKAE